MARILKDDLDGRMTKIVLSAGVGREIEQWIDLSRLDREQLGWWIDALREAESDIRRLRGQLEAEKNQTRRSCLSCGNGITGRSDQRYCSATCRQRARRAGL